MKAPKRVSPNLLCATAILSSIAFSQVFAVEITPSVSETLSYAGRQVDIDPNLILTHDGPTINQAEIFFTNFINGDTLDFDRANGINGGFDNANSFSLTMNGPASVEDFQEALRSVRMHANTPGIRNLRIVVDGVEALITVNVAQTNSPPTSSNKTITILEDEVYTFTEADFSFSDPDGPNARFEHVELQTGATRGSLTLNGSTVADTDIIRSDQFDAFVFTPDPQTSDSPYTNFKYRVRDGFDNSLEYRIDINVLFVNDIPVITTNSGSPIVEHSSSSGDAVLTYSASDEEDGSVTNSVVLINNSNGYYSNSSDTVRITSAGIDFVNAGNTLPNVELSITDSGNETGTSSTPIVTTLTNDTPEVSLGLFWPLVENNLSTDSIVAVITATDEEGSPNIAFVAGSNTDSFFRIEAGNVLLTQIGADLGNNGGALPTVRIIATDDTDSSLTDTATLTPNIFATNDTPEVTLNLGLALRERAATNGTFVASFNASDEDGSPTVAITPGSNSQDYYTLVGGNIWLTQTGADQVNSGGSLPALSITATDDTDSSLSAVDSKTPVIKPYNFPPDITLNLGSVIVENTAIDGTEVATFIVVDIDGTPIVNFTTGTNSDNYYKIVNNVVELTQAGADYVNADNSLPLLSLTAIDNLEDELFDIDSVSPVTRTSNDNPALNLNLADPILEENATNNTVVAIFEATDEETTPNVSFSTGTNLENYYRIVGNRVLLTQAGAALVNSSGSLPRLSLTATDQIDDGLTDTQSVEPIITSINDRPSINLTLLGAVVEDEVESGDTLASFTISDEDGTPSVEFTVNSNDYGYYAILNTQVIITSAGADYVNSGNPLPAISLTVIDDVNSNLTQVATQTPTTTLTNDRPEISVTLSTSITEGSTEAGTLVARFVATDEDGQPSVDFTPSTNSNTYYNIEGNTVVLTLLGADLVNTGGALPALSLTVTDDSDDSLTQVDTQTPTITPYNDPPELSLTLANAIIEDSATDSTPVANFDASDEDGTPIVNFTAATNNEGYYRIVRSQVELTQKGADFVNGGGELPSLSITATDDADSDIKTTETVTPVIIAFNDTPTITLSLSTITEGSTANGTIVALFDANDEDGTPSTAFTAGSNASAYFKIVNSTIQLTQEGADFVNTGGALPAISLIATDDADSSLSSSISKTPVIIAFNDLPVIQITLSSDIVENSASEQLIVATFTSTDEDGSPLVNFTSASNTNAYYRIQGSNVELTQAGADFVNNGGTLPELSLTAIDDADSNSQVTDTVTPIIIPVNDAPEITLTLAGVVNEDLANDTTVVANFLASDEDGEPIVSFTPGTNSNNFYRISGRRIVLTQAGADQANNTVSLPLISLTVTDDSDAQLTAVTSVSPIVKENEDKDFDGIPNAIEGTDDTDGDGIPNQEDTDSDGDGLLDEVEGLSDSDGDGTPDFLDSSKDEDSDGIPDIVEGIADTDGDGIANFLDIDSDNDGISDGLEMGVSGIDSDGDTIDNTFDFDLTKGSDLDGDGVDESVVIPDTDGDKVFDFLDNDSDNDSIPDYIEFAMSTQDADNDGKPNHLDEDSDNDGISDSAEANASNQDSDGDGIDDHFDVDQTQGEDQDNNGIDDNALSQIPDTDNDSVLDIHDLDSDNDGLFDTEEAQVTDDDTDGIANPGVVLVLSPVDTDNDGIADFRDLDSNGDGVFDIAETAAAALDADNNGQIDPSGDLDGDGIDNLWDEQPDITGSSGDLDGDGIIDSADSDMDGDGIPNLIEGNSDKDNDGLPNHIDLDSDNDSIPDAIENNENGHDNDSLLDSQDLDSDNDGISDITESKASISNNGDMDSDGVLDYIDPDSDNDGLSDAFETGRPPLTGIDSDSDGIDDIFDADKTGGIDANKDGIDDIFEQLDSDGDGLPNYLDDDSDGDSIPDSEEQLLVKLTRLDSDNDGIDDAVDVDITGGIDANKDGIDDDLIDMSDIDGDGILNYLDDNSDGDYMPDAIENGDFNSDGILDYKQVNGNIKTGVKGGGSLNHWFTLLLCSLAIFRFSSIKKKNLALLSVLTLTFLSFNIEAKEQKKPLSLKKSSTLKKSCTPSSIHCWYMGGGLGLSFVNPEPAENSVWRVQQNQSTAFKLFAGISLSEHWFTEFSYESLGAAELDNLNTNVEPNTQSIDYSALSLSAAYRLRGQKEAWDIYTKVGFSSLTTGDDAAYITQDHTSQLTFSVGAELRYWKKWFSRLEFTSYDQDAKSLTFSTSRYLGFDKTKVKKKKPKKKKKSRKLKVVIKKPKKKKIVIKAAPALPPPVMLAPVIVRPPKDWKRPKQLNLDVDGDGILDELDECPKSPEYAQVDPRGCPLLETFILNVKFASNSSLVKREYLAEINKVSKMIKRYGNVHLTIEGHTDWDGTQSVNQPLSESRANAVADMIKLKTGLASHNFTIVGYGELRPIADNSTAQGRKKNQRIVIIISQQ